MQRTDTDHLHLARARSSSPSAGCGRVSPNPAGRRRHRPRRRDPRRGLARPPRRPARRGRGDRAPRGGADLRGRDALRLARALLPPGAAAAVHRRDPRGRHQPRRRRLRRPDARRPTAAGSGSCATRASRSTSPTASSAARARLRQPGLPQARPHRPAVGALQVGDDARRQGRHARPATRSGSPARAAARLAHRWRAEVDAVAVGIGTALADDPQLTARVDGVAPPAAPRRLRLDGAAAARLPARRATRREVPLTVVVSRAAPRAATEALEMAGRRGHRRHRRERARARPLARSTSSASSTAGHRRCCSRAARTWPGAFLDAGEIDEVRLFVAPMLLGGRAARDPLEGEGVERDRRRAARADASTASACGDDMLRHGAAAGVVSVFTGLVQDLGTVAAVDATDDGARLRVAHARSPASSPTATRSPSTASA